MLGIVIVFKANGKVERLWMPIVTMNHTHTAAGTIHHMKEAFIAPLCERNSVFENTHS
eukprot:UN12924